MAGSQVRFELAWKALDPVSIPCYSNRPYYGD
jgi:hypothetical protein